LRKKITELEFKIASLRDQDLDDEKSGYIIGIDTPPSSDDETSINTPTQLSAKDKTNLITRYEREIAKYKSRDISDFTQGVQDLKYMLTILQIPYIVVPENTEAEQIGAMLAHNNIIDYFITTDPDYLLFAAGMRITHHKSGSKDDHTFPITMLKKDRTSRAAQYNKYTLDDVLSEHKITEDELLHTGICMGVDVITHPEYSSSSGIKGIGAKSVIDIVKGIKHSKLYNIKDYHIEGMNVFKKPALCDLDIPKQNSIIPAANIKKFKSWIVGKKQFNEDNVIKKLKIISNSRA